MKLLMAGLVLAVASAAGAQVLLADTVGCITRKDFDRYTKLSADNAAFVQKLFDNASCYVQKDTVPAATLSQVGEATRVELLNGVRIWVPTAAISNTELPLVELR